MKETSGCIDLNLMIAYLENRLPSAECKKVEQHLKTCKLCSDAMDGLKSVPNRDHLRAVVDSLNGEIHQKSIALSQKKRRSLFYYAIAAALVIGLISTFFVLRKGQNYDSLFAEYFRPYPNHLPLMRGEEVSDQFIHAMTDYESEDYRRASKALREIMMTDQENFTAHFYYAMTELCLGHAKAAIPHLEKVVNHSPSLLLVEHAEWYLALTQLKAKNPEEAKLIFERIIVRQGRYHDQSARILEKLTKL